MLVNWTSPPTSFLLDKGVLREALRGVVHLAEGRSVPDRQQSAFLALQAVLSESTAFITLETANILRRLRAQPAVNLMMPELRVLQRGKYLLRWRRRLLDYEFSREDAMILSYGAWGVDMVGETIGAEVVVTTDVKLAGLWDQYAEKN